MAASRKRSKTQFAERTHFGSKTNTQATDTNGSSGTNEVQVVTLTSATDGTFRLAFGGQTTAPIAYNASNSTVDTALEALTTIGSGHVSVTGSNGGPWTVTFNGGGLAGVNVASLQGDAASTQSGSVSRTISYTYDTASELTSVTDPDSTYAYTYDYDGRQLTVDNNGTSGVPRVILTSVYDAASNRTKLSASVGGTADFENDYTFDNLNRMTRVEQIGQGGGNTVAKKAANFAYNALNQFTSVERQVKPSSTWNEVATTAFTYDTLNRIDTIAHKRSGSNLFTPYSYSYDRMDRITGITSQDGTVAYTYDKTSQLTGADYSYQTDETFAWDANGNPTGGSNSVSANNHLDSDGTYNYTYDDEGNLTRRTKISDSSYTDYTWDYRNRLTNVTNKTSGGTSTMSADYTYDVYDRRIKKVVDADGAGGGGSVTTRYVYEDQGITRVVLQFDGSNNETHRYLHGPAVDQLLADEDSSNALLWSLTDHLNTPHDLINNSGTTQNHIKLSSFGNVTNESNSAVDFLMGFAGMDRDEETGVYYSWHRPTQNGIWLGPDPEGFKAGDTNLTREVGNNPVNLIDSTGLEDSPPGHRTGLFFLPVPDHNGLGPTPDQAAALSLGATRRARVEIRDVLDRAIRGPGRGWAASVGRIVNGQSLGPNSEGAGPCYSWVAEMIRRRAFKEFDKNHPYLSITPVAWTLENYVPVWTNHIAFRVEVKMYKSDGTYDTHVFYIDNGWLGGDDHIFLPDDLPSHYRDEQPSKLDNGQDSPGYVPPSRPPSTARD